jgi:hypothetical protein
MNFKTQRLTANCQLSNCKLTKIPLILRCFWRNCANSCSFYNVFLSVNEIGTQMTIDAENH